MNLYVCVFNKLKFYVAFKFSLNFIIVFVNRDPLPLPDNVGLFASISFYHFWKLSNCCEPSEDRFDKPCFFFGIGSKGESNLEGESSLNGEY